jgi:hypothetical protein
LNHNDQNSFSKETKKDVVSQTKNKEEKLDLPYLQCRFCKTYRTQIQFDMENHLYGSHRQELLFLPLKGKGYSMEYRIQFVMEYIKQRMELQETRKNLLHKSYVDSIWLR